MFRDDVIAHYAARGYKVHESVQLRGETGRVHPCDLVAEGPLGSLVVTVRESGGATELASLRAKGKDLSATPVLAVPEARPDIRRAAMQMGIVVLQEADLVPPPEEPEAPPFWPDAQAAAPPAWPEAKPAAPRPSAGLWSTGETVQVERPPERPGTPEASGQAGPSWLETLSGRPATPSATAPERPAPGPSEEEHAPVQGSRTPLRPREELVRLVDGLEPDEPTDVPLPPRPALQRERQERQVQRATRPARAKRPRRRVRRQRLVTARHAAQAAIGGIVAGAVVFGLAVLLL